jgi:hypothetical protein
MMKNASIGFLITVALAFSGMLYAQEEEPHVYTIVTWESLDPEGGSNAERDSLGAIRIENVVNKNEFILNQSVMTHMYGSNSSDFVVITEYKSFADIEKATKRNGELFREFMPDSEKRAEFWKAFGAYFGKHSDEIYQGL